MGLLSDYLPNWLPDDPNQQQAVRNGLLNFGAAMLQGRGNFGNALGGGIAAGTQGYGDAVKGQQQAALNTAQTQRWNLENQGLQAAIDRPKRLQDILNGQQGAQPPSASSALAGGGDLTQQGLGGTQQVSGIAPLPIPDRQSDQPQGAVAPLSALPMTGQAPAPQTTDLFAKYKAYGDKLSAAGEVDAADKYYALAEKMRPKLKEQKVLIQDGKPVNVMTYEDGTQKTSTYGALPDNQIVGLGDKQMVVDKNMVGSGQTYAMGATPGELLNSASNAAGRAQSERHWQADQASQKMDGMGGGPVDPNSPATAIIVQSIIDGRKALTPAEMKGPYGQSLLNLVAQKDPSFDMVNFSARAKARGDFMPGGKSGENIKNINTAIAHIGGLNDQMTAMNNSGSQTYNKVRNWVGTNVRMDKGLQDRIASVGTTTEGVAGEMAKVFRSTGMSEHEIEAWRKKFTADTTPGAQQGAVRSAMYMLQGRLEAIGDQYRQGMGTTAQPLQMLTPQSQSAFDKLSGNKVAPPEGGAPASGTVKGGYVFKGGNPADKNNWVKQ